MRKTAVTVRAPTAKIATVSNTCTDDQTHLENSGSNTTLQLVSLEGKVDMMNISWQSGQQIIVLLGLAFLAPVFPLRLR